MPCTARHSARAFPPLRGGKAAAFLHAGPSDRDGVALGEAPVAEAAPGVGGQLVEVLQRFVDKGNTVVVIEHNLDVIKCADYIIDLGPEGGVGGGTVVACGTPEEIAACPASYTGQYLKKYLK